MREILFRGKRFDNGEWVAGFYCTNSEWDRKTYGDKRKSTDLTRFGFCPDCGKAINWEQIRKEDA